MSFQSQTMLNRYLNEVNSVSVSAFEEDDGQGGRVFNEERHYQWINRVKNKWLNRDAALGGHDVNMVQGKCIHTGMFSLGKREARVA